jgi:branched-chain amino acid transport system substrate-binding protein
VKRSKLEMRMKCWIWSLLIFTLVSAGAAHGDDAISIGAIYALTGPATAGNAYSLEGARLAAAELNQKGGVLGRPIQLLVFDDLSTPIGAHVAAKQAVEAGVAAIIGPPWSSHALHVAEVAQAEGIPMITDFSTNPRITAIGDFIFRVCFTDQFQGHAMARFAREDLGAATAVILINLTSNYSVDLAHIIQKDFEQLGGHVLARIEYKPNQPSFAPVVQQAEAADADVIFFSGHDESGLIIRASQGHPIRSIPVGGDGWSVESFFDKGGYLLSRGYYCSHWARDMASPASHAFLAKYGKNATLDVGTALAYDAVMLLADAINRAGRVDRQGIRDALATTRSFPGVTGRISFDKQGDPLKRVVIMQIRDGKPFYLKTMD